MTLLDDRHGAERASLVDSAERFLRERLAWSPARAAAQFDAAPADGLWQEVAELGWLTSVVPETAGGLGVPLSLASVLCEALAPGLLAAPLARQLARGGYVLGAAIAGGAGGDAPTVLEDWLAGRQWLALVDDAQAGPRCHADGGQWRFDGVASAVPDGVRAGHLLVLAGATAAPGGTALFLCPASALARTPVAVVDSDGLALAHVDFAGTLLPATARLAVTDAASLVAAARELERLYVAAELAGLMGHLLRLTHDHLATRQQFGQALATFQVLQHRVVDRYLDCVGVASLLAWARDVVDLDGPVAAAPAIAALVASAASAARAVGETAVQLHGAIGTTAELAVGALLRRLTVLGLGLGEDASLRRFGELRGLP